MNIRKTLPADLTAIGKLYEAARAALGAMGVDQWQTGDYPSAQDAEADRKAGVGYVLEQDGEVLGVACIAFGREPVGSRPRRIRLSSPHFHCAPRQGQKRRRAVL